MPIAYILLLLCFVITASLGFIILKKGGVRKSFIVTVMHGLLAALSLVGLLLFTVQQSSSLPRIAFACGVIAAPLGFIVLYRDISHKPLSGLAVIVHALLGMGAIVLLLCCIY